MASMSPAATTDKIHKILNDKSIYFKSTRNTCPLEIRIFHFLLTVREK